MSRKRLKDNELTRVQINLRIHDSTMQKLKKLAFLSGTREGSGHCRLAREILEGVIDERLRLRGA